ncbi:MAG: tRNA (adenosine(37)-N6)-threonylcarbamoyltransferase complex dimerization subunit type 1 TsaB [Deltaproteobacteria bacterium]|nr:MAG: tRNA (adenosine(37)-N6)-threonylcarbamoyltransferase complex dimerization subunit type 1 TsaB [Deltaproteobacteria bacterium]
MTRRQGRLILAVESTCLPGSLALGEGGHVLAARRVPEGKQYSGEFLPLLDEALREAGREREDLGGVVVTTGPGSFTGIRVGLAFAKGIAAALKVPLFPIPTLDAMARAALLSGVEGEFLCPLLDARKGEVYAAFYRIAGSSVVREGDYISTAPENLLYKIENRNVAFFGPGFRRYEEVFSSVSKRGGRGTEGDGLLDAGCLLEVYFRTEIPPQNPVEVTALYVRPSEAELKKKGGRE